MLLVFGCGIYQRASRQYYLSLTTVKIGKFTEDTAAGVPYAVLDAIDERTALVEIPAMTPTTWNKLMVICLLAGLCLVVAACGRAAEPVDEGPNAHLSNAELLASAIKNMKQLESYQMVFRGSAPDDLYMIGPNTVITAQMQSDQKGSRIRLGAVLPTQESGGTATSLADPDGTIYTDMLITEEETYHSDDGGKTWRTYGVDTGGDYLLAAFGTLWDTRRHGSDPTVGEQLIEGVTFEDGIPRTEVVDSVVTRRMVARWRSDDGQEEAFMFGLTPSAGTSTLWVSTDMTPTIRQMHIEGTNTILNEDEQPTEAPYTMHWKWSRFNEDFGKVEPPPPDSIRPPY